MQFFLASFVWSQFTMKQPLILSLHLNWKKPGCTLVTPWPNSSVPLHPDLCPPELVPLARFSLSLLLRFLGKQSPLRGGHTLISLAAAAVAFLKATGAPKQRAIPRFCLGSCKIHFVFATGTGPPALPCSLETPVSIHTIASLAKPSLASELAFLCWTSFLFNKISSPHLPDTG